MNEYLRNFALRMTSVWVIIVCSCLGSSIEIILCSFRGKVSLFLEELIGVRVHIISFVHIDHECMATFLIMNERLQIIITVIITIIVFSLWNNRNVMKFSISDTGSKSIKNNYFFIILNLKEFLEGSFHVRILLGAFDAEEEFRYLWRKELFDEILHRFI